MAKVYNGENEPITIVTDDNADVVIAPGETKEIETEANFNSDGFYVMENGDWYAKDTGTRLEIYNAKK